MAERTTNDIMQGHKPQQVVTDTLDEQDAATGGRARPTSPSSSSSFRSSILFEARLEAAITQRRAIRRQRKQLGRSEPKQRRPSQQPIRSNQSHQAELPRKRVDEHQEGLLRREGSASGGSQEEKFTRKGALATSTRELIHRNEAHRRNGLTRSRTVAAASQRRGSILERTSIKLNRLLESSISMLPPPDLSRAAAAAGHRIRSTMTRGTRERPISDRKFDESGQDRSAKQISGPVGGDYDESSLDRDVDGGYAWIILAVMFIINASTFGTARAYGMIYDKLAREGQLNHDQAARPFNVMGAIENMAGPLTGCLLARGTSSWRIIVFSGSCLVTLAHLLAAVTPNDSLEGHLLSMGLMCGLGLSFVTISFFQINNAYFVHYRSRAFGIGISGAAFGTLYIAKLCQWALDEYEGTSACYLVLCLLLAPNVLLSLLLKPKRASEKSKDLKDEEQTDEVKNLRTISLEIQKRESQSSSTSSERLNFVTGTKQVLKVPIFHMIWPTQLLFCWFNFVLGMIMVDFAKDRGLNKDQASYIVPVWAFGQLTGRLVLSTLVDLKLLSYRSFTVICFATISSTTYILNEIKPETAEANDWFLSLLSMRETPTKQLLIMMTLVFLLSAFIALLYILLNGLVVTHMDQQLQPLSMGISSFLGSFFLLPRASVIGFFRDSTGNYDSMLSMFSVMALVAALTWLIVPTACKYMEKLAAKLANQIKQLTGSKANANQKPQLLAVIKPSTFRPGMDVKAEKQTHEVFSVCNK